MRSLIVALLVAVTFTAGVLVGTHAATPPRKPHTFAVIYDNKEATKVMADEFRLSPAGGLSPCAVFTYAGKDIASVCGVSVVVEVPSES